MSLLGSITKLLAVTRLSSLSFILHHASCCQCYSNFHNCRHASCTVLVLKNDNNKSDRKWKSVFDWNQVLLIQKKNKHSVEFNLKSVYTVIGMST